MMKGLLKALREKFNMFGLLQQDPSPSLVYSFFFLQKPYQFPVSSDLSITLSFKWSNIFL